MEIRPKTIKINQSIYAYKQKVEVEAEVVAPAKKTTKKAKAEKVEVEEAAPLWKKKITPKAYWNTRK